MSRVLRSLVVHAAAFAIGAGIYLVVEAIALHVFGGQEGPYLSPDHRQLLDHGGGLASMQA